MADRTDEAGEFAGSLRAVGAELRRIRQSRGLSLRELGARANLSPGFLSLAERGACSLSLTSLFALAAALAVEPGDLLHAGAGGVPRPTEHVVTRADQHAGTRVVVGEREYCPLSRGLPDRALEGLLVTVRPTGTAAPESSHAGEEIAYVLSGELVFTVRGEEIVLAAGDSIHLKSRTPHTMRNRTGAPAEALWVVTEPLL